MSLGASPSGALPAGTLPLGTQPSGTPPLGVSPSGNLPSIFLGACLPTRDSSSASIARHSGCVRQAFVSRLPTRGASSASTARHSDHVRQAFGSRLPTRGASSASTARHSDHVRQAFGSRLPTRGASSKSIAFHSDRVRQAFGARLPTRGASSAALAFWPSAYIAFGHAAFGHAAFGPSAFGHAAFGHAAFGPSAFGPSAFGPTAFGLTAFGHTAFDRVRHAFGARLYPLTLPWCVTWPPRSPLPTPPQRRGVDPGGAYTVLATEPVLEASTWFASTPYPACLWRTWALTFMVLSRHTWWASWEGRKLGAATPSWPSRVALRRVSPRGNPPASTPRYLTSSPSPIASACRREVSSSFASGTFLSAFRQSVCFVPSPCGAEYLPLLPAPGHDAL